MKTKVKKWGNSLAVRIPQTFARELGITDGSSVDVKVENGKVIIEPAEDKLKKLEKLLENVTPENLHEEVDWGNQVGKEEW